MWSNFHSFFFLIFFICILSENSANAKIENSKPSSTKNLIDSIKELFSINLSEEDSTFEKVKKEKSENRKQVEFMVKKYLKESFFESDRVIFEEDDYQTVKRMLQNFDNTDDLEKNRSIVERFIELFKEKYETKLNKLLLQESMQCKINDIVDEFQHLDSIRSKLKFGDIIEFKRVGYSHFSVYLNDSFVLQFQTPMYSNITIKNVFRNFPSYTLISNIDELSYGDPVRVNNKIRLNLPINFDDIESRVLEAIEKNSTVLYNIFLNNCEHFAMKIRFGIPFSDQIDALIKISKDILIPIRKTAYDTFIA